MTTPQDTLSGSKTAKKLSSIVKVPMAVGHGAQAGELVNFTLMARQLREKYRYQDYLDSVGHSSSKAYVLSGGIKGWLAQYKGQDDLVDYD